MPRWPVCLIEGVLNLIFVALPLAVVINGTLVYFLGKTALWYFLPLMVLAVCDLVFFWWKVVVESQPELEAVFGPNHTRAARYWSWNLFWSEVWAALLWPFPIFSRTVAQLLGAMGSSWSRKWFTTMRRGNIVVLLTDPEVDCLVANPHARDELLIRYGY